MNKRLYRSSTNKIIAGVCGGLGEYFAIDPVFVRVFAVLLAIIPHGFGLVAYIVAWIIIPKRGDLVVEDAPPAKEQELSTWNSYLPGIILVGIGLLLLAREFWYWFDWEDFWPILLIVGGLYLILRRTGRKEQVEEAVPTSSINGQHPKTENGGPAL